MIEPEVAFNDLEDNMNLAEDFMKHLIAYVMEHNADDLAFLDARLAEEEKQLPTEKRSGLGLIEKLKFVLENSFERITYTEAIDILLNSNHYKKKKFTYDVKWGIDLQSEHERFLVEQHFKKPVIVTGYPAAIKAFYMRMNDGCAPGKETVAAMDILAPGIGEIVGGSQREERLDKLEARMNEMHIPLAEMSYYLDTRRFGTVPHAGFGLGFERMVQFVTGMTNIRDVIPFARTPKNCEY
jgi:asparaginyl-tRNA synthetase